MFCKRPVPLIGILAGSTISGYKAPKTIKCFDYGGVGLGIVAALDKTADCCTETTVLFSRNLNRSAPIPISSPKSSQTSSADLDEDEDEYTTVVNCRLPNNSFTKVYCDRSPFMIQSSRGSVFHFDPMRSTEANGIPASDFLSNCYLCRKRLQGEDIYMYRGEKAFCSAECRYRHIATEEMKDKCGSEAIKAVDISRSPYANGQIGILAI